MNQTIRLSSCVSVHGEFVKQFGNGEILVRDGQSVYRGLPISSGSRTIEIAADLTPPFTGLSAGN